jgi:invasion protein IalB
VKPESLSICAALESVSIRLRHSITVSRRVVKKPDNPKGQRLSSRPPGVATPPVDSCHPDARRDPQRDNPSNTPSAETILAAGIFARATERPALNDNEEGVVTLPLGVVIPTPGGIPVEIINQADRLLKRSSPQGFFARPTERPALNDNEEGVVTPPLGVVIPTPVGIPSETTLPTHRLLRRSSPQGCFARTATRWRKAVNFRRLSHRRPTITIGILLRYGIHN